MGDKEQIINNFEKDINVPRKVKIKCRYKIHDDYREQENVNN